METPHIYRQTSSPMLPSCNAWSTELFRFLVNNVFNTWAGNFRTPTGATPLFSGAGASIGGTANPNQPRLVTASYTVAIGRDADAESEAEQAFGTSASSESLVPGYLLVSWPMTKPADPFRHNIGSACTPAKSAIAEPIIGEIRTITNNLEQQKTSTGYPKNIALPTMPIPGFWLLIKRLALNTRLRSHKTTKISVTDAFLSCGYIHVGAQANASATNLPYPPKQSLTSVNFYYTPDVGIYFIQVPAELGEAQKFRTYQIATTKSSEPFLLSSAETCEPGLKPIAERLLSELKAYFERPSPDSGSTADWKIVLHQTTSSVWYELDSDEIGAVTSVINCAHVSSATAAATTPLGLDGASQPAFNYAPDIRAVRRLQKMI